jgi:cell division cycle protein 37
VIKNEKYTIRGTKNDDTTADDDTTETQPSKPSNNEEAISNEDTTQEEATDPSNTSKPGASNVDTEENASPNSQTSATKTDEKENGTEEKQNNNINNINNSTTATIKKNKNKNKKSKSTKSKSKSTTKNNNNNSDNSSSNNSSDASENRYASAVAEDDDNTFVARSDPQIFLDQNMHLLQKFVQIKKNKKANKFLRKNFDLIHEASEGYLITYAVDRAVEGAKKPELKRLAIRCLMVHNLVQSCTQANVNPEKGARMFFMKMANKQIQAQYQIELNVQCQELLGRIEVRRQERLAQLLAEQGDDVDEHSVEYVNQNDERAPSGPGGLDPTEVLNTLPVEMQDAFMAQDVPALKKCLSEMAEEEANYHMQRCIDSGLWVQPTEEEDDDVDAEADAVAEAADTQGNEDGDKKNTNNTLADSD